MHAENLVGALIGQHFDEAFGLVIDLRPAVGGKGKLADLVGASFGLQLLLGLAHGGNFRFGVDHPGNRLVIDLGSMPGDSLDTGDGFIFGLVRKHRPGGHVANNPDTRHATAVLLILQHAALVGGETHGFQPQAGGIGAAANGDQHIVSL